MYGRIQDPVDAEPLERLVLERCTGSGLGAAPVAARVRASLREAAEAPWFCEGLMGLAVQKKIPFGPKYGTWRKAIKAEMRKGRHLYFAGPADS